MQKIAIDERADSCEHAATLTSMAFDAKDFRLNHGFEFLAHFDDGIAPGCRRFTPMADGIPFYMFRRLWVPGINMDVEVRDFVTEFNEICFIDTPKFFMNFTDLPDPKTDLWSLLIGEFP